MKPVHRLQICPPTISPSYIQVRAVVWECSEGQTDIQTHTHTHTHMYKQSRDHYTFHVIYDSHEM